MKSVVITGPESSGKTTLASQLAEHFGVSFVPEFARQYLNECNGVYEFADLGKIGKGQLTLLEKAKSQSPKILICDTGFEVLKIWSDVRFGKVESLVDELFFSNLPDLFLLCEPDLPWEPDPLRENPYDRLDLFKLYKNELSLLGVPFKVISGFYENRFNTALKEIQVIIQSP